MSDGTRSNAITATAPASSEIFACPARLSASLKKKIQSVCRAAYLALGVRDWCRIDVRLDESGKPFILELNPLPGILPNPLLNALPDGLHVLSVRPVQVNRIRLVPPWIDAGQSAAPCLEQDLRVGAPEGANLDALTGQPVARQELAELVPANQHLQICRVHRST